MKSFILFSVVYMQLCSSFGRPNPEPKGVGSYSYIDSSGNRYEGTYDIKDGKVIPVSGDPPPPLVANNLEELEDFPDKLNENLQNFFQQVQGTYNFRRSGSPRSLRRFGPSRRFSGGFPFGNNNMNMGPNFPFGGANFGGPGFGGPGFGMPNTGAMSNNAFASASSMPGYSQQQIFLNPANPAMPNVDVANFADGASSGPGSHSVSSSSYVSSSNINGKPYSTRGGHTMVTNNGRVTKYDINS